MPIDYEIETNHQQIAPILVAYSEWCEAVIKTLCYPETASAQDTPQTPDIFLKWIDSQERDDLFDDNELESLRIIHDELVTMASQLVKKVLEKQQKTDSSEFGSFMALYDNFVQRLRMAEQALFVADIGLDAQTRLRNRRVMLKQLNTELDRRSRGGTPFCLVLCRIDNFSSFKNEIEPEELVKSIQTLAGVIKQNLRNIDDAYRTNEGEFLLCMKQTDKPGANAMINRIRKMVEEEDVSFKVGTQTARMSMSYIVAEPIPGDTIEDLIKFMKDDMDRYATENDTALEYLEQTRLQRYLEGAGEASGQLS